MCSFTLQDFNNLLTPLLALGAIVFTVIYSRKNIWLSGQLHLINLVSGKAKDCNLVWANEPKPYTPEDYHILVISEMIISIEVIDRSVKVLSRGNENVSDSKEDIYYIFWKQLHVDVRGWASKTRDFVIRKNIPSTDPYAIQVETIHKYFEKYFE